MQRLWQSWLIQQMEYISLHECFSSSSQKSLFWDLKDTSVTFIKIWEDNPLTFFCVYIEDYYLKANNLCEMLGNTVQLWFVGKWCERSSMTFLTIGFLHPNHYGFFFRPGLQNLMPTSIYEWSTWGLLQNGIHNWLSWIFSVSFYLQVIYVVLVFTSQKVYM